MKECIELEECEAIDLGDNGPHQQNRLLNLLGYIAREGYTYQDGSDSGAPAVIYADADYEIGDGKCGLHETVKSANEPAIVYVRADTVLAQQSAIDTLTARVAELEEVLDECETYFDNRADAEYFTDSPFPVGNEEMGLLVTVRKAKKGSDA